jgi:hypothetical protein
MQPVFLAQPQILEVEMKKMNRNILTVINVAVLFGASFSSVTYAQEENCKLDSLSGTFTANATTVGFIAGVRWGSGTLTLKGGTKVNFSFKGMKALETGASVREIEGEVYNLKNIEDFIGVYYGGSQQMTMGTAGKGEAVINNSKCVVIKAKAKGEGVNLSAPGPSGVHVQLAP